MDSLFLLLWLSFTDLKQSEYIFKNIPNTYEANPILGTHTTSLKMGTFGIVGTGLSYYADKIVTPKSHIVMDSIITSEIWNIEQNERIRQGYKRESFLVGVTIRF